MRTIRLFDLLTGFSSALDLVTPALAGHHIGVAYLSVIMAGKMGLSKAGRRQLLVAAMLHDIGTVPMKTETRDLIFEIDEGPHSLAGWAFCKTAGLPDPICRMVLHHHTPWNDRGSADKTLAANLIHLADRLDVALRTRRNAGFAVLSAELCRQRGKFAPRCLSALHALTEDPAAVERVFEPERMLGHLSETFREDFLGPRQLRDLCGLFSLTIDSKSPFTATHSSGVAHTARDLLKRSGLADPEALSTIFVAGLLHDIGKLAVPLEILEKPSSLTPEEFENIKHHAAVSLQLLGSMPGFACIRDWGGLHHERLDGNGYPLGLTARQLSLPTRIMAVADVFTALTEDRPYRAGMKPPEALAVMKDMARQHALDSDIVALLAEHTTQINRARIHGQRKAAENFRQLRALCDKPRGTDAKNTISRNGRSSS